MQTPSPRLNNISNNAFPPIGTFTLESTTPQSNQMFPPPSDFFNTSTHSNSSHLNGTVGNSGNSSSASSIFSSTNNNGGDPNQATRETGIIEKLLVCAIYYVHQMHNRTYFLVLFSKFQYLSSTPTDSYNAVKDRLVCFFISRNSVETLSI